METMIQKGKLDYLFAGKGNTPSIIANRISNFYNLKGPSLSVDTACSSSLVALELACKAVREGNCGSAIVCGVNLSLNATKYRSFCAMGALSDNDRIHAVIKGISVNSSGRSTGATVPNVDQQAAGYG